MYELNLITGASNSGVELNVQVETASPEVEVVFNSGVPDEVINRLSEEIVDLSEAKADKAYMVALFNELKQLILSGDTDGAIAVLDRAILDTAILA